MLENSILWRRDYRPDELDPEYIKPEVIISEKKKRDMRQVNGFLKCHMVSMGLYSGKRFFLNTLLFRPKQVKCTLTGSINVVVQSGL